MSLDSVDGKGISTILMRFSDKRRIKVESQTHLNYIERKISLAEHYVFNFLPIAATSTLLAPLQRLKIILQVQPMIPQLTKKGPNLSIPTIANVLRNEHGYLSFWRGNFATVLRVYAHTFVKITFYDRIKNWENKKISFVNSLTFTVPGLAFAIHLTGVALSTLATLIFTYPFDLATTRLSTDLNKKEDKYRGMLEVFKQGRVEGNKDLNLGANSKIFFFKKYYQGLKWAILQTLPYNFVTLTGYQVLLTFQEKNTSTDNNYLSTLGATSIIGILASLVSYPFDTYKRIMQVNGTSKMNFLPEKAHMINWRDPINQRWLFNGLSLHIARSIPFSFIQYNIFKLVTRFLNKKDKN